MDTEFIFQIITITILTGLVLCAVYKMTHSSCCDSEKH